MADERERKLEEKRQKVRINREKKARDVAIKNERRRQLHLRTAELKLSNEKNTK